MTNPADPRADFLHVFKVKAWMFFGQFVSLVLLASLVTFMVGMVVVSGTILRTAGDIAPLGAMVLCMMLPLVTMMLLVMVQYVVGLFSLRSSYIKATADGLEWKYWPYSHVRCRWADLDRLGKMLLFSDVLYLRDGEVLGPSLSMKFPLRLFRPSEKYIALTSYNGWPKGQLEEDLRQHAPQVFEGQRSADSLARPSSTDSGPSEEQRLLAALTHAAVIVYPAGILAALIIWATQRTKSELVRFQALQALIWQVIMGGFEMLLGACMMLAVMVPVFSAGFRGGGVPLQPFNGWLLFSVFAMTGLMVLVTLAFEVYAIVGAVKVYRGEDFRYAILGNLLKGKGATRD